MKIFRILLIALMLLTSGCSLFRKEKSPELKQEIIGAIVTRAAAPVSSPTPCISPLAAVKYPALLKHIPIHYSVKFFYKTFGNARQLVIDEFKKGRQLVGVDGLWEDDHEFNDKHIPEIKRIGNELQQILNQFPGRKIKYRPFTEHKIAKPDQYLEIAQAACPGCIIVNSAWTGGFTENPKFQNEVHGIKDYPKSLLQKGIAYNYDYDGDSSFDSDRKSMAEKHSQAEEFCDWTWDLNQKINEKDKTPRPQRVHKPTKKVFDGLIYFHEVPKGTHNDLPKDWLYKSCAERHAANDKDPRACTPLFIAPNGKQIVVKMVNGKKLFTLSNKGKYEDGKHFIYRPATYKKWGYQYGRIALKKTGVAVADVFLDGKKVGRINPGYRDKQYRDHIQ